MVLELIASILAWIKEWLLALHPASLFLLAFAEAIFFPIPPDVVLLPLSVLRPESAPLFGLLATAGSVAGASVAFALGLRGGRPLVQRLLSPERLGQVEGMLQRYDVWATGIAGFTPIPYKVFAIAAGVFRLSFPRFIVASLVSRGARFMLEAFLVMKFGEPVIDFVAQHFGWLTFVIAALVIVGYVLVVRRRASAISP